MELQVTRLRFSSKSTQGELSLDGEQFCYTLELAKKDYLPGSCIPPGRYKVVSYPSPHFGRLMPLLVDVPGRSEIEIHWLNHPQESRGCIGIGFTTGTDFIGDSRRAFDEFWEKAQGPIERGECFVAVVEVDSTPASVVLHANDL